MNKRLYLQLYRGSRVLIVFSGVPRSLVAYGRRVLQNIPALDDDVEVAEVAL